MNTSNTLKVNTPQATQNTNIVADTEKLTLALEFSLADAVLEKVNNDLIFNFENGASVTISGFYEAYSAENMPNFFVNGQEIAGADFFAAFDQSLMPAAGPTAAAATGEAGGFDTGSADRDLANGVEALNGIDGGSSYNRQGGLGQTLAQSAENTEFAGSVAPNIPNSPNFPNNSGNSGNSGDSGDSGDSQFKPSIKPDLINPTKPETPDSGDNNFIFRDQVVSSDQLKSLVGGIEMDPGYCKMGYSNYMHGPNVFFNFKTNGQAYETSSTLFEAIKSSASSTLLFQTKTHDGFVSVEAATKAAEDISTYLASGSVKAGDIVYIEADNLFFYQNLIIPEGVTVFFRGTDGGGCSIGFGKVGDVVNNGILYLKGTYASDGGKSEVINTDSESFFFFEAKAPNYVSSISSGVSFTEADKPGFVIGGSENTSFTSLNVNYSDLIQDYDSNTVVELSLAESSKGSLNQTAEGFTLHFNEQAELGTELTVLISVTKNGVTATTTFTYIASDSPSANNDNGNFTANSSDFATFANFGDSDNSELSLLTLDSLDTLDNSHNSHNLQHYEDILNENILDLSSQAYAAYTMGTVNQTQSSFELTQVYGTEKLIPNIQVESLNFNDIQADSDFIKI